MRPLVAVVGSLNVDTVLRVERHPRPGETVMGLDLVDRPGGKGANQALAVCRTGADALLVGRIGVDEPGRKYRKALAREGVNVEHLRQTPRTNSGRAIVNVDALAENSIVVIPGANTALSKEDVRAAEASIAASAVILLQLESPREAVEEALRLARKHSVLSVLNASPVTPWAAGVASRADVVILNEHEHAQLPDVANPCITLGSKGAIWGSHSALPCPVNVVDTTGAGDAFAGALAGCIALGLEPRDALGKAVEAGTKATLWQGAQPWTLDGSEYIRPERKR